MRKAQGKLLSSKGFSLIEILISIGLVGVLSLVLMTLVQNSNKAQKTISQILELDYVAGQAQILVTNHCDKNFKDLKLDEYGKVSVSSLKQKLPDDTLIEVIKVNTISDDLKIDSITLAINPLAFPMPGTTETILGNLIISALRDSGSTTRRSFGSQGLTKKIPVSLRVDDTKTILGCGIASDEIPSGAVMAFNLGSCPAGWTKADGSTGTVNLEGRNIIGVHGTDTDFDLRDTGGEKKHTMKIEELVSHQHTIRLILPDAPVTDSARSQSNNNTSPIKTRSPDDKFTEFTGGGQAFNVMDPYVALLYCQKD